LATIRKRRDKYEVQVCRAALLHASGLSAFSSTLRLGFGKWRALYGEQLLASRYRDRI
jgi:hypothetical protein